MSEYSEIEALGIALKTATPTPDPDARARTIEAAVKNFSQSCQEHAGSLRHKGYQQGELLTPLKKGIAGMKRKTKAILAGGSAIATTAVGVFAIIMVQGQGISTSPNLLDKADQADFATQSVKSAGFSEVAIPERADNPLRDAVTSNESIEAISLMPQLDASNPNVKVAATGAPAPAPAAMASTQMIMGDVTISSPGFLDTPPVASPDQSQFDGKEIEAVKLVAEDPVSTFSIDVDTASYAHTRRMIESGMLPSPDSVRIEEMVNYFPYGYAPPEVGSDDPFATHISVFESPWNTENQLVRIGIQGVMPEVENRPPLDLVFLIDTSGSMNSPDKIGLLKQSLIMMLSELHEDDRIGIVTYAGSAGVVLEMTPATDKRYISTALDALSAGGSTAGAAGLKAAYGLLSDSSEDGRIGRVLLATDGDFNVGMSSVDEMKSFIEEQRDSGAYLSVLGFGTGNYNDALMQTLAQNGNGTAAYIDSLSEARKVLVDQLSGALFPIANDVKIQVEWNPEAVREYRLIGYETRMLRREDFNNDKVDAGEIGAGHQVTALYEITATGSESGLITPSRYEEAVIPDETGDGELGYVNIRYKTPGETVSTRLEAPILADTGADEDALWAAAIAGFGQLLKDDRYLGSWSFTDAAELAASAMGEDDFGYRHEAVQLIHLSDALAR